ncbi:dihydrofolate reductase family protein [Micromonospora aurantiaca]|uniref:dihydrofolate reductase family protein n=1 Tax=Micromonospora aurantiaca (nom. illeg.) TaxID=47850 RepID=UPI00082898AF|nr:dihydrofolate reductase family protein [Micromonospora aurantiaca]SCL43704.1 Pyrimidine reductase, riboflavin biosynthesis [Micromonospora aurantiaca]
MTLDSTQGDPAILSALEHLSGTWSWGRPPRLLTLTHRPPQPAVPTTLAGGVGSQTASDLLDQWIDKCRHHRGLVDVQRDLGVDAVGVAFETGDQHVLYVMDRSGVEYLVEGQQSSTARSAAGTNLGGQTLDALAEQLAELTWRLAGWAAPAAGARIRDMWPKPGLVDLDDDELHDRLATDAGHLRLLAVTSIDGLAAVNGTSAALSSPGDQRVYQAVKRDADVLLVGAGTVRAEQYGPTPLSALQIARRRSLGLAPYPTVAVVSRSLDLDLAGPLFQHHTGRHVPPRPIVIAPAAAAARIDPALAERVDLVVAGETDVDLALAVQQLRSQGHQQLVCEGGPSLAGAMTRAGLLDEICMTVTPQLLATPGPRITDSSGAGQGTDDWQLRRSLIDEQGNLFLRYDRLPR